VWGLRAPHTRCWPATALEHLGANADAVDRAPAWSAAPRRAAERRDSRRWTGRYRAELYSARQCFPSNARVALPASVARARDENEASRRRFARRPVRRGNQHSAPNTAGGRNRVPDQADMTRITRANLTRFGFPEPNEAPNRPLRNRRSEVRILSGAQKVGAVDVEGAAPPPNPAAS
jgi:hypothetical protein